jgi:hypothetical protein
MIAKTGSYVAISAVITKFLEAFGTNLETK